MALQQFNNGESLSSVRTKLNENTTETEKIIVKTFDYVATSDLASGNVTSQGANSITDNTKVWTTNQFAGKGVRLVTADGEVDYTRIASNTATVLTFDTNHAGYTYASYRILPTFEVTNINSITSVDILANDCAIILPNLESVENRKFVRVYLERSNNNGKRAAIICVGDQKQRGLKYGFLNYRYEGVEFWSHMLTPKHWDILGLDNIKRYTALTSTANNAVTATAYATAFPFATTTLDSSRRFESRDRSGAFWFKYMSITPLDMLVQGTVIVTRSGGGASTVTLAVRIKRFNGGATVDSVKEAVVKFDGDTTVLVPLSIDVALEPYDEVTIVAKRSAGTVTIEAKSSIVIKEM